MDKNEYVKEIINQVHKNGYISISKDDSESDVSLILELKARQFLWYTGRHYEAMPKSYEYINSGLTYDEFNTTPNKNINVRIGHNIYTDSISHSDLSIIDDLSHSINPPNDKHHKHIKMISGVFNWIIANVWKVIIYTVIGVIIWYITIKHPLI